MKFLSKKQSYIPLNDKVEKFVQTCVIISTLNQGLYRSSIETLVKFTRDHVCEDLYPKEKVSEKVSEFYYAKIRDTCILHSTLKIIGHTKTILQIRRENLGLNCNLF